MGYQPSKAKPPRTVKFNSKEERLEYIKNPERYEKAIQIADICNRLITRTGKQDLSLADVIILQDKEIQGLRAELDREDL